MDLATLVAPLSPERPCGDDLSFAPELDTIREMRREDDPTLDQGDWVTPLKVADWPGVAKACEQLLGSRTKDLGVAGWLLDAQARLQGFEGLTAGLVLLASLVEQHWPEVHPCLDDDPEPRIGSLAWSLSRVEDLASRIPLIHVAGRPCGLVEVDAARQRRLAADTAPTDRATGAADTAPTLEAVWRQLAGAGREAFAARQAHIDAARAALQRLQSGVDAQLPTDGPSFAGARAALDHVADAWVRLGREAGVAGHADTIVDVRPAALPAVEAVVRPAAITAPTAPRTPPSPTLPEEIQSRAQALQRLRSVATYFRRAEPHSPVAYLADKAADWGDMTLRDWLQAVVKDGSTLTGLCDLLGIPPPTT